MKGPIPRAIEPKHLVRLQVPGLRQDCKTLCPVQASLPGRRDWPAGVRVGPSGVSSHSLTWPSLARSGSLATCPPHYLPKGATSQSRTPGTVLPPHLRLLLQGHLPSLTVRMGWVGSGHACATPKPAPHHATLGASVPSCHPASDSPQGCDGLDTAKHKEEQSHPGGRGTACLGWRWAGCLVPLYRAPSHGLPPIAKLELLP